MSNYHMLVRLVLSYLPAKVLPAVMMLGQVFLFTHCMTPTQYGRYSIAMAVMMAVQTIGYQWLRLGVQRFYHQARQQGNLQTLLRSVSVAYSLLSLGVCLIWVVVLVTVHLEPELNRVMWIALPVGLARSLFELNLELYRASFEPIRYGILSTVRAVIGFLLSYVFLVLFGWNETGAMLGLLMGDLVPAVCASLPWFTHLKQGRYDTALMLEMLRYAWVFSVTALFSYITVMSDRFFLQRFYGAESVGLYSVAYDLTQQSLVLLLTIVHLAAYPLAIRAFEQGGVTEVEHQLRENAILLLGIALPATIGFAIVAPDIIVLLFGSAYQGTASMVMPWIALSTFLLGLKEFYFDVPFNLSKRTGLLLKISASSGLANLMLNGLLIPKFGIMGAIYSTVGSYGIGLGLTAWQGRRVFRVPVPFTEGLRMSGAALIMALVVKWFSPSKDWIALGVKILFGAMVYVLAVFLFYPDLFRKFSLNRLGG